MSVSLLAAAGGLLSLERVCYVWTARAPDSFRRWCARPAVARLGDPVAVVRTLFYVFKVLQGAVFAGWCWAHGSRSLAPTAHGLALLLGAVLVVAGQILSGLVFYRLGRVTVFFGDRLGHEATWCEAFPFSVLRHPQYVGTVMTIWGVFLIARFPHDDWYLLPVVETLYYLIGASLEGRDGHVGSSPRPLERDDTATREPCTRPASARSG